MLQIRQSVWETNSSSTHSLSFYKVKNLNIPHYSSFKIDEDFLNEKGLWIGDELYSGPLSKLVFLITVVNGLSEKQIETYLQYIKEVVYEVFSTTIEIDYDEVISDDNTDNDDILRRFIYSATNHVTSRLDEENFKQMVREVLTNPDIILESKEEEY